VTRRIPYAFDVSHPALAALDAKPLHRTEVGDTRVGPSLVDEYCCPSEPFGPPPDYFGKPMDESGSETLYTTVVQKPLVNLGVSVIGASASSIVDPWFLGSKDERDVQGYAATPVNMNDLMFDFSLDIGAAGVVFPRQQQFYVAVDSGSDPFSGRALPGRYRLRFWTNDLKPPALKILTARVGVGRPTIVARVTDAQSGVDPLSLVIGYGRVLVGAALYDPDSGRAIFPLPAAASRIPAGKTRLTIEASDYQETKNIATLGNKILPNTSTKSITLRGVAGPAVTWLAPRQGQCVRGATTQIVVAASSNTKVVSVRFSVDGKQIALDRNGAAGIFGVPWHLGSVSRGIHRLEALATDAAGKRLAATRAVNVCK
jgi:hypothetical protein